MLSKEEKKRKTQPGKIRLNFREMDKLKYLLHLFYYVIYFSLIKNI